MPRKITIRNFQFSPESGGDAHVDCIIEDDNGNTYNGMNYLNFSELVGVTDAAGTQVLPSSEQVAAKLAELIPLP